jgi:lipid-A-disaccharide synthase
MPHDSRLRIFFSVGEPSGDLHGANLIRALQSRYPGVQCVGYGGPQMASAGCQLHTDLTALAVMWLLRVLMNLHVFIGLLNRAERFFRDERPDAVVLIDYPGFNWWIARKAKKHGIPVFYFTPPQIWAWGSWRVRKMRRFVDHVLCALPFEEDWFRRRGCRAEFVGHPFFDEVERRKLDAEFLAAQRSKPGRLVTLLPGSRTQEVTHNLHWFLKTAALIRQQVPDTRFAIASFKQSQAEIAERLTAATDLPIEIHVGRTQELIASAECCLSVSGSVSLELLHYEKPTVILYWITPLSYWIQKQFRRVKYITLVNLLNTDELYPRDLSPYDPGQPDAERVLFPEYLTSRDRTADLARHIVEWLTQPDRKAARIEDLRRLKQQVAHGGASDHAAEYILRVIAPGKSAKPLRAA